MERSGVERRRHQGVLIELAAEVEPLTVLPAAEGAENRCELG
jgi:hypothetical protein